MSKTSTDAVRHTLNGPTMGSRWTAVFYAAPGLHREPLQMALQTTVDQVDAQMSTWRDDSELMRLNQVPVGMWCPTSPELLHVLTLGLAVGRTTRGAFDIGMGDATHPYLTECESVVLSIRKNFPAIKIAVGGQAFIPTERLWEKWPIDFYSKKAIDLIEWAKENI